MQTLHVFKQFGVTLNHAVLNDGSPVYVFYRKGMPIALRAIFFAGARFDRIPGTAHFVEHLLVNGSKKYPSRDELVEAVEAIGGYNNAATGSDKMQFLLDFGKQEDIGAAIDILHEILDMPLFNTITFEKERGAILSEFRENRSDAEWYVWYMQSRQAFKGMALEESTLGDEKSISSIQLSDLINYYTEYISSGRSLYLAAGDVDIDVLVKELNEKIYLPKSHRFTHPTFMDIPKAEHIFPHEQFADARQTYIALGFRLPELTPIESLHISLATSILGSGGTSRLFKKLRKEHGLVYGASASFSSGPDYNELAIGTSCKTEDTQTVLDIIEEELKKLIEEGVTEDELSKEKNYIFKSEPRQFQTSSSWVNSTQNMFMFWPDQLTYFVEYDKYLREVTVADLNKTIKKALKNEYFYGATAGPSKIGFNLPRIF